MDGGKREAKEEVPGEIPATSLLEAGEELATGLLEAGEGHLDSKVIEGLHERQVRLNVCCCLHFCLYRVRKVT